MIKFSAESEDDLGTSKTTRKRTQAFASAAVKNRERERGPWLPSSSSEFFPLHVEIAGG